MDAVVAVEVAGSGRAALAEEIRRVWSRCLVPGDGAAAVTPDAAVRVVVDDDPRLVAEARAGGAVASGVPAEVMHGLSPVVTLAAIEHQAGRLMMLHACGLADPASGRTVALVAASGTGKTTAARRVGTTLGYVSDETIAVRADGTVAPYPKPLSVVDAAGGWVKQQVSLDELGLIAAPAQCRLAGLAMLVRDGAEQAWLEPVTTVESLAALAPQTSYLSRIPQPLHRLAAMVEAAGGLRLLHYRDSEQLPPVVAGMLA
jgi:hypothetical protein